MSYGGELSPSFSVTASSGLLPVKMNAFQRTRVSFTALLCHLSRLFQRLTFCIFALSGEGEQGRDRHRTSRCMYPRGWQKVRPQLQFAHLLPITSTALQISRRTR